MHKNSDNSVDLKDLARMLAESKAAQRIGEFSAEQWESILQGMSEQEILEGLMILNEEKEAYKDVELEKERKLKVNKTRLLQRNEQVKMEADQMFNKNKNG